MPVVCDGREDLMLPSVFDRMYNELQHREIKEVPFVRRRMSIGDYEITVLDEKTSADPNSSLKEIHVVTFFGVFKLEF